MAFVLSLIGRLQDRFGVARRLTTELRKAESADNLKVSEIANAEIYSSMLLMSSMGMF